MSDQGSHFINKVLTQMAKDFNVTHKPTVAYAPWVNGSVERLNRDILAITRALLAELKLGPHDWPAVIDSVPSIINCTPLTRLGINTDGSTRSPLQVMTCIYPRRPILRVLPSGATPLQARTLTLAQAQQAYSVSVLQKALDELHKDVGRRINTRRKRAIEEHNRKTNIVLPRFSVGEFVLVRRTDKTGHKLSFRWSRPRRIIACPSELVYVVQNLNSSRQERVHCARIILYSGSLDNSEIPAAKLDFPDRSDSRYEVLESIVNIGEAPNGLHFQLRWDGLPDQRDLTWGPISTIYQDVPDMVLDFLRTTRKKRLAAKAASQLGISI